MKNVIMIAHAFPPEGKAGAYRPLRFVRYLPALGWFPVVISAELDVYERYDADLLPLVPESVDVVRVRGRDWWQTIQAKRARRLITVSSRAAAGASPAKVMSGRMRSIAREAVRRAEAWLYHPDMAHAWIRPAVEATVTRVARDGCDVIWATAWPASSFVVAYRASQLTGVPYVLDFRDAWTITHNDFVARRPFWATRADRRALYQYLKGARAVTFRYHAEAECYWRAYAGALDALRIHIIPNGYDGTIDESAIPGGDRCTILYAGTLSSYRYDTLLEALTELKKSNPARAGRIRLLVVGEGSDAVAAAATSLSLSDIVETLPPVSHDEIARLQSDAHALLVLGRPSSMKGHELFAGAKLFGYLKAGRPIVGIVPQDETRRILQRVGVSTIADGDSPTEIVDVLEQLLDAWAAGTLAALVPRRADCEAYSAVRQTSALTRALEGRPAVEPFVPNAVEVPRSLRADIHDWSANRLIHTAGQDAVLHS